MVPSTAKRGLRVLAVAERIVPESADAMTWKVSEHGMAMSLARDVPQKIAQVLRAFVSDLLAQTGRTIAALRNVAVAVHPGGPKIIDGVRDTLELWDEQVAISREVLHDHGNMSSATLPHIWQRMIEDERVPAGTLIPSLAFGPGLTVCGALLEKV
jgi:predicted naringenin-chalcone synthase